jgi:phosphate transport system protein
MADSSAHMLRTFDEEMREVQEAFRAMATRCRDQIHLALDAFWSGSKEKADRVEISDASIDADEKSIDDLVLRLLALRQPVASDLRTLTALFKLVTDLERIGDEAVDIARGTVPTSPGAEALRSRVREMAQTSESMFESAVSSFLDRDAAAADAVRRVNGILGATYE